MKQLFGREDEMHRFKAVHGKVILSAVMGAIVALVCSGVALAEEYPAKPIQLIIPFSAGGSTDIVARQLAANLSEALKQQVVPVNQPGAAGNIAAEAVVRAAADGYTLLWGASVMSTNVAFGPAPPFDPSKDLAPVALVAKAPFLVAVNPKIGIRTMKELVDAAKANPNKYTIGAAQLDSYVGQFGVQSEIRLLFVPYKGGAQSTADAVAGHLDMAYSQAALLLPFIQSGRLHAIGVSSEKRLEVLPDVPTFLESGVSKHVTTYWYGVFAPAQTPAPIIDRLSREIQKISAGPMAKKLAELGIESASSTPQELGDLLRTETAYWLDVAKTAKSTASVPQK
jgi:tripartite-type tricarboxylate transporter receptor subunit TctC